MPAPDLLHRAVGEWYRANARNLPWRKAPYLGDPYAVLVSEVMLQQTQVDRTVPKFLEWMALYPRVEDLAEASVADIITLWSGMGYNNRAVRLHRLAQAVVVEHGGRIPSSVAELRALPGIGPYTAAAVACFAFDDHIPVLDTNIYRVLSRVHHGTKAPPRSAIDTVAVGLVPPPEAQLSPSHWHQALMDIGGTICTVAAPRCMLCPLRDHCAAAPELQAGGNRKLAEASVPYAPKQSKFAGSTRFYRGRIVDALRAANGTPIPISSLTATFPDEPVRVNWESIIDGLLKDGLAVREGDSLRLP